MMPTLNLVPIWTTILAVGVFLYVALDGFDLGVGMLYNFAPDRDARNLVMNSIAPIWDGNETWLILGSVGLLAAFPVAFAIIIPAVYFPILLMLLSLIFRGVAFEFRYRDAEHRTFWDHGFAAGSALAAFAQGVVLGAFIQGFDVEGPAICRRLVRLLHAVFGFHRRRLDVRLRAARRGLADHQDRRRAAGLGAARSAGAVSSARCSPSPSSACGRRSSMRISRRAGSPGRTSRYLAPVPLITAGLVWYAWRSLNDRSEYAPFLAALGLFVMSYLGIAISLWPMIVPGHFTLRSGCGVAKHAGLPLDRHAGPAADDLGLHGLVVLGVSRQGASRHRISLATLGYRLE